MAIALEASFGARPKMLWHKDTDVSGVDLIVIPGGFSFGDYLRCGAMAAHSPIMRAIHDHAAQGRLRARGLQRLSDLTEAGILPARSYETPRCGSWRWTATSVSSAPTPLSPAATSGARRFAVSWHMATATTSPTTRRSIGWRARTWSPCATPPRPATHTGGESERQRTRHRRDPQPEPARARADAASRGPGGPADGRH